MKQMQWKPWLGWGLIIALVLNSQHAHAQYSADFQTNVISGITSNWPGVYFVGFTNFADALVIQNGGVLSNGTGYLGYNSASSNNIAFVTGPGSVWSNRADLYIGQNGSGNSLVISNGGQVVSGPGGQGLDLVGETASSSNNSVAVTGPGSAWVENQSRFLFGNYGAQNTLLINNGGLFAVGGACLVGFNDASGSNSLLVTDTGSIWSNSGTLAFGYNGRYNSLVISNGGMVVDSLGYVYSSSGITSNTVLVTGSGSVWNNSGTLVVGQGKGSGNSLVIQNGGLVICSNAVLLSTSNLVLVTGSTWSNRGDLYLGSAGTGNSLVISNSGQVVNGTCYVGDNAAIGGSNSVRVAGGFGLLKTAWGNDILYVGYLGSGNSVVITGGSVSATNVVVGAASATCDNVLELDGGSLVVTNATGTGVLEVRNGEFIFTGGVLQADTLVLTNPCAQFVHTGGTLIVGNVVLDPNFFRITSITRQSNDLLITWLMGPGATNALQVATGGADDSYTTNGFTDIFVVTNNTKLGTVTNYLDVGAATNVPARYYRARLAP